MTPEEMLKQLNGEGESAGADYNDGIDAYFGWRIVNGDELIVWHLPCDENGVDDSALVTHRWRLIQDA